MNPWAGGEGGRDTTDDDDRPAMFFWSRPEGEAFAVFVIFSVLGAKNPVI